MKFSYEDLISGDLIFVPNICHFRSPLLKELNPTSGIGYRAYNFYLNMLVWEKTDFINFVKSTTGKKMGRLESDSRLNTFDAMTVIENFRELLRETMVFFMDETLSWNEQRRAFLITEKDSKSNIGCIDRNNFDEVRDMMLQVNYINIGDSAKPLKHSTKTAQDLWERAQQHLKENSAKSSNNESLNIGNMISKLSAASTTYNLFNIYNLTVFQLYDQFFQYGYLRAMNLNEMAYSNHGGENFDMQAWLKPILKI